MSLAKIGHHVRLPWHKHQPQEGLSSQPSGTTKAHGRQFRFLNFLPLHIKNHLIATVAEFTGTFMFLLFAFGGTNVVNSTARAATENDRPDAAKLLYISLCFGMSLAVNAWVFYRISGGLFNPAVSLALVLVGVVRPHRGVLVVSSQLVGAIAAAAVINGLQAGPLSVSTTLAGGTSVVQGLFIEVFLTAQLVFTVFMLAAEKHMATFIAPVGIGLSLFVAEMMGVYHTGGSLNPARSFGPCVITGKFPPYHWIYWIGPFLGAFVASAFYIFNKAAEYETVNPQQDHAGEAALDAMVEQGRLAVVDNEGDMKELTLTASPKAGGEPLMGGRRPLSSASRPLSPASQGSAGPAGGRLRRTSMSPASGGSQAKRPESPLESRDGKGKERLGDSRGDVFGPGPELEAGNNSKI